MILEWSNAWQLLPPDATGLDPLLFNQQVYRLSDGSAPLGFFFLDGSKCAAGAAQRITRSNIAQADGEITHRKFKSGQVLELTVQLWQDIEHPACDGVLREMGDLLDLYLTSIENDDGIIQWTPTPFPGDGALYDREFVQLRSLGPSGQGASSFVSVNAERDEASVLTTVTFALLSPIPYAIDATQTTTEITDGTTVINTGNADSFPVLKVFGPTDSFAITNESILDEQGNPLSIAYDASLPGAVSLGMGDYAEIDFFRNTIYLNGNEAASLKAGINVMLTDFWPLIPGENLFGVSGGYAGDLIQMLWQSAWA